VDGLRSRQGKEGRKAGGIGRTAFSIYGGRRRLVAEMECNNFYKVGILGYFMGRRNMIEKLVQEGELDVGGVPFENDSAWIDAKKGVRRDSYTAAVLAVGSVALLGGITYACTLPSVQNFCKTLTDYFL